MTADQPAPDGAPILLARGLACERGGRLVFGAPDFAVAGTEGRSIYFVSLDITLSNEGRA